jgi:LPPG:FO 2-phospho-L-lactate transferase
VGAARLLRGVVAIVSPRRLTVIVNTADDEEVHGLHVSPDLDTTVYNLAGVAPRDRGWGIAGDGERLLAALSRFGQPTWFRIGDQDFATHLFRTAELRAGRRLHEVTARIARAFGVRSDVFPMSNDRVRTVVRTPAGDLSFQRYFVQRRARDRVVGIAYRGLDRARPAPGVLAALRRADLVLLPPSNPFTSILPILGVRGVRRALRRRRAPVVAVSPVAAGRAVRGPLGGMLRSRGLAVSPSSLARIYPGLLDGIVIDRSDRRERGPLERLGLAVAVTDIRMNSPARSRAVAEVALGLARDLRP